MTRALFLKRMFVWPLAMMPAFTLGVIVCGWIFQYIPPQFIPFLMGDDGKITPEQKSIGFISAIACLIVALIALLWPVFVGGWLGRKYRGEGQGNKWLWTIYGLTGFTSLAYLYLKILMALGILIGMVTA